MAPEAVLLPGRPLDAADLRRAYRRVFDPLDGEVASPIDRAAVLEDLTGFCCFTDPFTVQMDAGDVGYQLAVQEGRRTVVLRILGAVKRSLADQRDEDRDKPYRAEV